MTSTANRLRDELAFFSDVGTDSLIVQDNAKQTAFALYRNGVKTRLRFDKASGSILQSTSEGDTTHASYRALLASTGFADLRSWAGSQQKLLRERIDEAALLPVSASLDNGLSAATLDGIDNLLVGNRDGNERLRTLLIDGPAGVGKTVLIERLALRRARNFMQTQAPLILHVQSRGRVLSFLQDLMAYSLQTMRVQATYDQLPILVRHGLVQLAIDGFDELGDPDGYDNAWAQLAQTVEEIEGHGALILAGRETFIGRERLLKAIPRLREPQHRVDVLSLKSIAPHVAKKWLSARGWQESRIAEADQWGLFEPGSYALRPFFLSKLAELFSDHAVKSEADGDFRTQSPLIRLATAMIEREAGKFGDRVERDMDGRQRQAFVIEVLTETAREIADSQTDSIDEEMLNYIVDGAHGDRLDDTIMRLLKNRVQALAFLALDERRGYRRFAHSEFYNFFLSHAAITAICHPEMPKFLRRTILGADFLASFGTVLESLENERIQRFVDAAQKLLAGASNLDRGGRNIAALLLASLPVGATPNGLEILGVNVDDAVIRGKAQTARIGDSSINQLDVRETDIFDVRFASVAIGTLIADEATRLPPSFPDVGWIQLVSSDGSERTLSGVDASDWIDRHGRMQRGLTQALVPEDAKDHPLYELLQKACRTMLRHHWIRSPGSDRTSLIATDPWWQTLATVLVKWELLTIEDAKQVGGRPSTFYHIKHAREILAETRDNEDVANFLSELVESIRGLRVGPPPAGNSDHAGQ